MKYLLILEGEPIQAFNTREDAFNYLESYSKELKARGVERVEDWLADFEYHDYSCRYTDFPELILPMNADDLMKILLE